MSASLTVLAVLAAVAGFAAAGAVPGVAVPRVALQAPTLQRAAGPKRPLGARCREREELLRDPGRGAERLGSRGNHGDEDGRTQVAEAAVQAGIAQTGSVNPMAVTPVGTVAFFPAVLPEKSLGAP